MTDLPDVKLRALTNFPVAVTGRAGINVVKINGRWYIDLDVSGFVQNSNIPVDQVANKWITIWDETLNSYQNVPYSLVATAGVASLAGKAGALDIGNGLIFTGDTLETDFLTKTFETRTLAIAATIPGDYNFVRTEGYNQSGDGGGALHKRVSVPAHNANFVSADGAIWELNETRPHIAQFGGFPWDGVVAFSSCPDITPALNKVQPYLAVKGLRALSWGSGIYRFVTKPDTWTYGFYHLAQGRENTHFHRDYVEANGIGSGLFTWSGAQSFGILGGASIVARSGSTGGSMISIISTASVASGFCRFENLNITASSPGSYISPITIDGSAHPNGARTLDFIGSTVFSGTSFAFSGNGNHGLTFLGTLAGTNTTPIQMQGSLGRENTNCQFLLANAAGVDLNWCLQVTIASTEIGDGTGGDVTIASNCAGCIVNAGRIHGTVTNGSATSHVFDGYTGIAYGVKTFHDAPVVPVYTVTTLPPYTPPQGSIIYVSDETGGGVLAFGDGAAWRRVTDRAIVS